jgi:hypothetical protein
MPPRYRSAAPNTIPLDCLVSRARTWRALAVSVADPEAPADPYAPVSRCVVSRARANSSGVASAAPAPSFTSPLGCGTVIGFTTTGAYATVAER